MIGVFDSGIGGLTVVRALLKKLPGYEIAYFGDTARAPYETKSAETVSGYAIESIDFLLSLGVKLIIAACNTVSRVAMPKLRERSPVPVFDVVSPVVEAVAGSHSRRIGVIGTRTTITSRVYERKILDAVPHPHVKVFSAACPLLVPLVEEGWLKKPVTSMIVKKYLHPLKVRQIDTLILGCTHYPLLEKNDSGQNRPSGSCNRFRRNSLPGRRKVSRTESRHRIGIDPQRWNSTVCVGFDPPHSSNGKNDPCKKRRHQETGSSRLI